MPPAPMGWTLTYSSPTAPCAWLSSPKAGPTLAPGIALGTAWSPKLSSCLCHPLSFPAPTLNEHAGCPGACVPQVSKILTLVTFHYQMPDSLKASDSNPRGRVCSHELSSGTHWDGCPSVPWDPTTC